MSNLWPTTSRQDPAFAPTALAALPVAIGAASPNGPAATHARRVADLTRDELDLTTFRPIDAAEITHTAPSLLSRFVDGALTADWACYSNPEDRAEFARLDAVIRTFPAGFRLWVCRTTAGEYLPVAYTGWYPITLEAFAKAHDEPHFIQHRRELWPLPSVAEAGSPLWLFNYCIVGSLRRAAESRIMLRCYADDLSKLPALGLAAAVLSPESIRVVERFGMTYRGDMTHDGASEKVFAVRLPSRRLDLVPSKG